VSVSVLGSDVDDEEGIEGRADARPRFADGSDVEGSTLDGMGGILDRDGVDEVLKEGEWGDKGGASDKTRSTASSPLPVPARA
jgi:hypothetical protein